MENRFSRAPKQLGDFGEGLVTYTLIRKGYEVACVDHVGAERSGYKIAVSVNTRMYRSKSVESRGAVFEFAHIEKLEHFSRTFSLDPVIAHGACLVDDQTIHLFMLRVADIRKELKKVKHGYRFQYGANHLPVTSALPCVDYSCWGTEQIAEGLRFAKNH